jgi:hypothetical protein
MLGGVKHGDAINGFNVCLEWAEENQVALQDILALRRLRESALILKTTKKEKQTTISDFFKK